MAKTTTAYYQQGKTASFSKDGRQFKGAPRSFRKQDEEPDERGQ